MRGEDIYLATWSDNGLLGFQAELCGQENQGRFEGDLDSLKDFVFAIKDFVNQNRVTSSRVVGNFGLGYGLARMTLENGLGATITKKHSWFMEPLYSMIMTLPKGTDVSSWNEQHGHLEKIGTIGGSDLLLASDKISVADIKETYAGSWKNSFPKLS